MFQRILVPTDGSETSARAVTTAVALARALGAEIHTLSVKETFPFGAVAELQPAPPQEFYDAQDTLADRHVQSVRDACAAAGVPCQAETTDGVQPWEAIVAHAEARGCDLLVMGSQGRTGFSALLLGSETQDVLSHTKVPVLVVR